MRSICGLVGSNVTHVLVSIWPFHAALVGGDIVDRTGIQRDFVNRRTAGTQCMSGGKLSTQQGINSQVSVGIHCYIGGMLLVGNEDRPRGVLNQVVTTRADPSLNIWVSGSTISSNNAVFLHHLARFGTVPDPSTAALGLIAVDSTKGNRRFGIDAIIDDAPAESWCC